MAGGVMVEPVGIDNVKAPGGGRIGLVHCPGTGLYGALPEQRAGALDVDLSTLRQWGAVSLVTLLRPFEMDALGVERLGERARALGLDWWHLPITDGCAPGAPFEDDWREAGPALHGILDEGGRLVLHCRAGIGRTGTVAARLLIERGMESLVLDLRRNPGGSLGAAIQTAAAVAVGVSPSCPSAIVSASEESEEAPPSPPQATRIRARTSTQADAKRDMSI